jgi:hypothetical protein
LPLGVSFGQLARIITGTVADEAGARRFGGGFAAGLRIDLAVVERRAERVALAGAPIACLGLPVRRSVAAIPRVLTRMDRPEATVSGNAADGVLLVTPFSCDTTLLLPDGSERPYQSWPRPITGALSLGNAGDVAWSNVIGKAGGARPYLMYRQSAVADIVIIDLPFRPSAGLWWQGRLLLTCLPTADSKGGIGSWTPAGELTFEWPNLTLYPIRPHGDRLALDPFILGSGDTVLRQNAAHGWTWLPGETPVARVLGPHGAESSITTAGNWTAHAHPQSDLIRFVSADGHEVLMCCYYPLKLAWAGESLCVSTAERELLIFENLLTGVLSSSPRAR